MRRSVFLVFLCVLFLTGCSSLNFSLHNKGRDSLTCYANNRRIGETFNKERISDFSKLITHDKYTKVKQGIIPTGAKQSYTYVLHKASHNITMRVIVYSNAQYAKLKNVPVVGNGEIKLVTADFNNLNRPHMILTNRS